MKINAIYAIGIVTIIASTLTLGLINYIQNRENKITTISIETKRYENKKPSVFWETYVDIESERIFYNPTWKVETSADSYISFTLPSGATIDRGGRQSACYGTGAFYNYEPFEYAISDTACVKGLRADVTMSGSQNISYEDKKAFGDFVLNNDTTRDPGVTETIKDIKNWKEVSIPGEVSFKYPSDWNIHKVQDMRTCPEFEKEIDTKGESSYICNNGSIGISPGTFIKANTIVVGNIYTGAEGIESSYFTKEVMGETFLISHDAYIEDWKVFNTILQTVKKDTTASVVLHDDTDVYIKNTYPLFKAWLVKQGGFLDFKINSISFFAAKSNPVQPHDQSYFDSKDSKEAFIVAVDFSIKPIKDSKDPFSWRAGNGYSSPDGWVLNKSLFLKIDKNSDGNLYIKDSNTGL